jgi:hypothetical protein
MRKYRTNPPLTYDAAITCMRRPDTRLVRMHGWRGGFYVVPGGRVDDQVATQIIDHPYVKGSQDGLFSGHDQTWRMADGTRVSSIEENPAGSPAIPQD